VVRFHGMLCQERFDLGLAAGGRMRQAIYDDPYGIDALDHEHGRRCFVTILCILDRHYG
jgi:hypothetical protein